MDESDKPPAPSGLGAPQPDPSGQPGPSGSPDSSDQPNQTGQAGQNRLAKLLRQAGRFGSPDGPDPPPRPSRRPEEPGPPSWATDPEGLLKARPGSLPVALTGGLASGKSTVATLFEVFGANRLDFDRFSREAVAPGTVGLERVVEIFGPKCLQPDGQLDRPYVRKRVFKDQTLKKYLEDIIHPATWKIMLKCLKVGPPAPVTVIEIPLLFEARLDSLFDRVILAFASPEVQLRRLMFRDPKLGKSQAKKMIASQMPILEKLRRAKTVVNNDGSLSEAIYQAKKLWDSLVPKAPPDDPAGDR